MNNVCGAPPTARTTFRLRMLPLDDTRTLKYNTLAYARILQKYNTYTTYPRALMAARPLADVRDAALFPNYFGQTCYYYLHAIHAAEAGIIFVGVSLSVGKSVSVSVHKNSKTIDQNVKFRPGRIIWFKITTARALRLISRTIKRVRRCPLKFCWWY